MIRARVGRVLARTAPLGDRAAHEAAEALGQAWFGPNFDESHFDAWAARCAEILFVAEDEAGTFLGYADQMFLAAPVERAFRAGTIAEQDFGADAVLGDDDVAALPVGSEVTLYLAGMCVTAPGTPLGREAAQALRACRRELVATWRARGLRVRLIMAAATEAGRRIAERAQGVLLAAGTTRRDGYDLFELPDIPDESALARHRQR